jgi:hypothetical protein
LPDSAEDSPTLAEVSRWSSSDWRKHYVLAGSSGKTSPAFCRRTEEGLLEPSSGRWANSGMGGPTESWTRSMCEWTDTLVPSPSDGGVCSLSHVLEDSRDVPERFYLSPKACVGILRRAERRGKALPPLLLEALRCAARSPMGRTTEED